MARNRKSQSESLLLGPALKASVICLIIVTFCVGYVWEKKQISDLSQQNRTLDAELKRLQNENGKLSKQREDLRSLVALEARVRELKLGLVSPQPSQIWRLPEPAAEKVPAGRTPQFAAHDFGLVEAPDLP